MTYFSVLNEANLEHLFLCQHINERYGYSISLAPELNLTIVCSVALLIN